MTPPNPPASTGAASGGTVESLLRAGFTREIEAQREHLPDPAFILLMARLEARNRRLWGASLLEPWSHALALGTVATVLAIWWRDATAGLDALLPLESLGVSWTTGLGLCAALFALLMFWSATLIDDG